MKRIYLLFFIFISGEMVDGQSINILPYPNAVQTGKGFFLFNSKTCMVIESTDPAILIAIDPLLEKVKKAAGYSMPVKHKVVQSNFIQVQLSNDITGDEAYALNVTASGISIKAKGAIGVFYAVQSLLQLLPAEIESHVPVQGVHWHIPAVKLTDAPAFKYRGIMLDVARHFMPLSFLKKMVDLMAMQKMNNLHLHLTDDQGWRIEIKKYPKLTAVGSVRNGTMIGKNAGKGNDNIRHEGFYSQAEIKELVAYAKKRFINIVPEIELPGHASAAIAAYPELSCFREEATPVIPGTLSNQSLSALNKSGTKIVQETWGVFQDVFCPTEFTFGFIQDIVDEITGLFPSQFIHIGGDECPKEAWKRSAFCQQLIKEKGLKDEHALQSYFIQRVEKYINSRGRQIIGWDEILEGGLAPNATVMSWRGEAGGIEAAKQSHQVIMTPLDYCYFNLYQSADPTDSIAWGGLLPLEKVYNYHPVPAELNDREAAYIIGVQGNLWTEFVKSPGLAEYMLFPRTIALAEVGWTARKPGFLNFVNRLEPYCKRLDYQAVNYSRHLFDIKFSGKYDPAKKELLVAVSGVTKSNATYYSTTSADLIKQGILYQQPVSITGDQQLTAGVVRNGVVIDRAFGNFTINKATGQEVLLEKAPSPSYNRAGNAAWVNGVVGSDTRYNDNEWLGFNGDDFAGLIHFEKQEIINSVSIRFFNSPSGWVYLPSRVSLLASDDGKVFSEIAVQDTFDNKKQGVQLVLFKVASRPAKYLKIVASNHGLIPKGSPGEGAPAWLFLDEVVVH